MNNHRLIHDAAFQMAKLLLRTVKDCLYEQEHREAFEEFYRLCKAGIEEYEVQADRMQQRLNPSRNRASAPDGEEGVR